MNTTRSAGDPVSRLLAALLAVCALYLALLQTPRIAALRSIAFGVLIVLTLVCVVRRDTRRVIALDASVLTVAVPLLAWAAWSATSLVWSVHPWFTLRELKTEVLDCLIAFFVFLFVSAEPRALRILSGTALGATAVMAALALGVQFATGSWNPAYYYNGTGAWSTHLVLVAPLALLLFVPRPAGFGGGPWPTAAFAAIAVLILAAARQADNRMVWPSLAVVLVVIALVAGLRYAHVLDGRRLRLTALVVVTLALLTTGFLEVARDKAALVSPANPSLSQAFAGDPRLALWDRTFERIRERPLTGFGYGRRIIGDELARELNNPLLFHAHNIFASQWLQTGAIGLSLLVATLGALAWRYSRFVRSRDATLAMVGVIGLALLAGFIVKNLTDDFLYRSNAREFWALAALLLGHGMRVERRVNGVQSG